MSVSETVPQIPTNLTKEAGARAPKGRWRATISLTLDREVIAKLRAEAEMRGTKPATLAADIVATIATDGLFTAVLDR
jgi:hypothetical protein